MKKLILIFLIFLAGLAYGQNTRFSRVVSDTDADSTLNDALSEKLDKAAVSDSLANYDGGDSTWVTVNADTLTIDSSATLPGAVFEGGQLRLSNHINSYGYAFSESKVAGENIGKGKVVYEYSDGKIFLAQGDSAATSTDWEMWVTLDTAGVGETVFVTNRGRAYGFSGLTKGTIMWLSTATAGEVTSTAPTTSGHQAVKVGKAHSASSVTVSLDFEAEIK